jgi:arylformamidase
VSFRGDLKMKHKRISSRWIDISISLLQEMVRWPGDPSFTKVMVQEINKGDIYNLSKLDMGAHNGTHVDAPLHILQDGNDISSLPIDLTVGPVRVIEILGQPVISDKELIPYKIRRGERLLFKTDNSSSIRNKHIFKEDYVSFTPEAADYLVQLKIKMVGIDSLSIGPYSDEQGDIHRRFLRNNIGIIEGLDLSKVNSGKYFLICLPLKIVSGDGAPARAIIKPIQ